MAAGHFCCVLFSLITRCAAARTCRRCPGVGKHGCRPRQVFALHGPRSHWRGPAPPHLGNCCRVWRGNSCHSARFKQYLVVTLICIFQILISWRESSWSFQFSVCGTHTFPFFCLSLWFVLSGDLLPVLLIWRFLCIFWEWIFRWFVCYEYAPADDTSSLFWHFFGEKT